jgi:hypothetical protein
MYLLRRRHCRSKEQLDQFEYLREALDIENIDVISGRN